MLKSSTYIVGVSGGVDSVALLDMLASDNADIVVAHFDHGIRDDSAKDALFVKKLAAGYGLRFETQRVELGKDASEAVAREARYTFLYEIQQKYNADAIVTAHHQDDIIETAIMNILRGTKRRGFISLRTTDGIQRPLLDMTKNDILSYAEKHGLMWREDSTNSDIKYRRNYIRKAIADSLTPEIREKIMYQLACIAGLDKRIDVETTSLLQEQKLLEIDKTLLTKPGLGESYEIAAQWLRMHDINFDENTVKRLVIGTRTLQNMSQIDLQNNYYAVVKRDKVVIAHR